jgi:hypothetical protein
LEKLKVIKLSSKKKNPETSKGYTTSVNALFRLLGHAPSCYEMSLVPNIILLFDSIDHAIVDALVNESTIIGKVIVAKLL